MSINEFYYLVKKSEKPIDDILNNGVNIEKAIGVDLVDFTQNLLK